MVLLIGFVAIFAALPRAGFAQEKVLTTVAAVHNLPADQAAKAIPVHIIATVTYSRPDHYTLFVADATGSTFIFASPVAQSQGHPLHRGDLVDITGITEASYRTAIQNPVIRYLGKGKLPAPRPATFQKLMAGEMDSQYVSLRGTIRSASEDNTSSDKAVQIQILIPGGIVEATLRDSAGLDLPGLIDAEVLVRGVAGGFFNAREQLMRTTIHLTDRSDLDVLALPKIKSADLPLTAIDNVLPTRFNIDLSKRVRVRGTVTFYEPQDSIVIQSGGESILASTNDNHPIALGSIVDVVGFADGHGYSPMLEQAEIFPTGKSATIEPTPLSYAEVVSGKYSDNLITLRGTVLSELHNEFSDSMVLLVDRHPVSILLWTKGRQKIADLRVGTTVAVTGICRILPSGTWASSLLFRLDIRQPGDVAVLALPSWWTVAHLLDLVIALLMASLLITGWALALRRRVSAQRARIERTVQVERQRSRLLEEINSITPLDSLLEDICSSIGRLVPDVQCTCELGEDEREPFVAAVKTMVPAPNALYEAAITGATGAQVGIFRVENKVSRVLSEQERETLAVGASLSTLAVNQRRLYQKLNYHSTHDPLTSLPNRRLSDMRLEEALQKASESGGRVGVVYIDVDRFKQVNDKFGHKTGDLYLQAIAVRLNAVVRESDLLARIGGDEFLLTACELSNSEDAETYRHRLQSCFDETFSLDGVTISGSASLGVAIYPDHGATASELQRHADLGMYFAKRSNRGEVVIGSHTPTRVDDLRELKETA